MSRISRPVGILFIVVLALSSLALLTLHPSTPVSKLFRSTKPSRIPEEYYHTEFESAPLPNATDSSPLVRRANATLLMLARNSDADGAVRSMRDLEDRFNRNFQYPWVFLNDEPFDDNFKKRVSVLTTAPVSFGVIPKDMWHQPPWIDEERASAARQKMVDDNIIYGGSLSYRNMCRFNSGFFYRHELLQPYRYYWRVEPDVHFHCNINIDPFVYMQDNNKTYGFTITMYEFQATIPTLWSAVREFAALNPQYVARDNSMGFMSDDGGTKYNGCHFWSNFEIADMDFWRGEAYSAFFNYLDSKGGFYYERWGDAPVHSIGAALLTSRSQIQFFREVGYEHNPYTHCPKEEDLWERGRCSCDPARSFDYDGYSCMSRWEKFMDSS
ncbi:glycosyltransferase family 15 protein [Auriscalpium vulgare]|uniref:Glycosyltransferase family 15 protein n=1 Tax=Auriscalpium vulgare TaxID=40419 RepID=A0ACB8RW33_9AGAM|nr:glycosyltransferase family 15 protein [Auriscalpium vulgare]